MKMAEGGDDFEALMSRMDKLQAAIDAIEGWELERQLNRAMDALRCPPGKPCTLSHFLLDTLITQLRSSSGLWGMGGVVGGQRKEQRVLIVQARLVRMLREKVDNLFAFLSSLF